MNAITLVAAQLARKPLQTVLGVGLLALGVATIVFLLLVQHQLSQQLARDARNIDLVVGAPGSPLQLVLSAVYHVDVPTGNVPLAAVDQLRANRWVASAIPISLGDSYRGFRIVGTESPLVAHYGATVRDGRLWLAPMEAVIGAQVARTTGLRIGDVLHATHGLAAGGAVHDDQAYNVVGILAAADSVVDRLILTDKASVWQVHEGDFDQLDADERAILQAEREVTAVLVRYASPMAAAILPRQINAEARVMAASPAAELARLFAVVGVGLDTLRAFAAVLIGAALLALFVTLYNALEERRYDIAVMRLLGASRARVAGLLLLEAWVLAVAALLFGLAIGMGAVAVLGQWLAEARAFTVTPAVLVEHLATTAVVALGVATLAAALPAWRASRMSVAQTLARG